MSTHPSKSYIVIKCHNIPAYLHQCAVHISFIAFCDINQWIPQQPHQEAINSQDADHKNATKNDGRDGALEYKPERVRRCRTFFLFFFFFLHLQVLWILSLVHPGYFYRQMHLPVDRFLCDLNN